jgi:hypothetical protein
VVAIIDPPTKLHNRSGRELFRRAYRVIKLSKAIGAAVNTEEKEKHGVGAFLLAGISFIPLIGIFTGIICIVIAVVGGKSNSKLLGILGFAGIMLSVVLYGSIFYSMFKDDGIAKRFEPHAISTMTSLVRHIEYYKLQNGAYPESMEAIRKNLKEGEMVFTFDVSGPINIGEQQRDFYYEVINSGDNYLLFGVGSDSIPFTEDDIFPLIDSEKDKNTGWLRGE